MSITSNAQIFQVDSTEYGYNEKPFSPSSSGSTIPLIIPKICGNIQNYGRESINGNGIFANDASCKPSYSRSVITQKTISPKLAQNMNWLTMIGPDGNIPAGTQFKVNFINGDINNAYFTTS